MQNKNWLRDAVRPLLAATLFLAVCGFMGISQPVALARTVGLDGDGSTFIIQPVPVALAEVQTHNPGLYSNASTLLAGDGSTMILDPVPPALLESESTTGEGGERGGVLACGGDGSTMVASPKSWSRAVSQDCGGDGST